MCKEVGSTNRKRVEEEPKTSPPQRSSHAPKAYSPTYGEERQSTVMAATVSSLGKHANTGKTPVKGASGSPLTNYEVMQCKFVESFEDGKTKVFSHLLVRSVKHKNERMIRNK